LPRAVFFGRLGFAGAFFSVWTSDFGRFFPATSVQGPGEDVADCQPGNEEPERIEDGPHRRECTPVGLGLAAGA